MGRRVFRARIAAKAVVVAATTGIGVGMLTPMAAHAAVACGQTITASTTLDHDLNCPATNAIFVGASNVVLDLGGHTISGPVPTGTTGVGHRGVVVLQNRTGVTVRNGVIRGFDSGVDVQPGANGTAVNGLTLDGNGLGIRVSTGTSANRLTGNTITNTSRFSAIQIGGDGHLVEGNVIRDGNFAGVFLSGNNGVINGNVIQEMGGNAVLIQSFPSNPGPFVNNQITANRITGSGRLLNNTAISVTNGSGTSIRSNLVVGRRATAGIFLLNSAGSVVSGNSTTNNLEGVLVRGSSTQTRIETNAVDANRVGIVIENGTTGNVVTGNAVRSNTPGDGIRALSPSTTLTSNVAVYNGSWGIFAVNGVTDGGGNRAFGNGVAAQCTPNIAC